MNRIDFIGPPGSGKTTLVNELISRSLIKNVSKISHARRYVLQNFFSPENESSSQRLKSFVIRKLFRKNYSTYSKRRLNKFLSESIQEYDSLLTQILNNLAKTEKKSEYLKYKRIVWFIQVLEDTLLVYNHYKDKTVLCDESLSSKIFQSDFGLSHDDIDNNFKAILMPRAFVHIRCNKDLLLQRLFSRKKLTLQHSGNDYDFKKGVIASIRNSNLITDKLMKLEVPYLEINSADDTNINIAKITKFINQLK